MTDTNDNNSIERLRERIRYHLAKAKEEEPWGLCDPKWEYVPSAATDVRNTWRKFGWTPKGEK